DVALIRTHYGDGIASIFARMPAEDADLIWTAADTWARRAKAAGDPRSLDQLRVSYLIRSATSSLTHADPTHCDRTCHPSTATGDVDDSSPGEPDPDQHERRGDVEDASPDECDPDQQKRSGDAGSTGPTRHGRAARVALLATLGALLGVTDTPGQLADS